MTDYDELHGVSPKDNPVRLRIHWTDYRDLEMEMWFNRMDREIAYIEIDGVRYLPVKPYRESCEVID